jgi:tetratricopeptide (TPR) repeat protein
MRAVGHGAGRKVGCDPGRRRDAGTQRRETHFEPDTPPELHPSTPPYTLMTVHRILLLAAFLLIHAGASAQSDPSLATIDEMRGDGRFTEALAALESLKAAQPGDVEVLWRLSRTRVDIGEKASARDQQESHYRAAIEDARGAVAAAPDHPEAHLALAIAAGRVGLISGTRTKVELSRDVKESVDRAIELNPNLGPAYHVRGRWNYEVASLGFMSRTVVRMVYGGLPSASYEQAAADFQKSIEIEDRVLDRLELGKTYLKLGERAKARAEFERALALPDEDPDDPEHKEEARSLLR